MPGRRPIREQLTQAVAGRAAGSGEEEMRLREHLAAERLYEANIARQTVHAAEIRQRAASIIRGYAQEAAVALLDMGYRPNILVKGPTQASGKRLGAVSLFGLRSRQRPGAQGVGDRPVWLVRHDPFIHIREGVSSLRLPPVSSGLAQHGVRLFRAHIGLDESGGILDVCEVLGEDSYTEVIDVASSTKLLPEEELRRKWSSVRPSRIEHTGDYVNDHFILTGQSDGGPDWGISAQVLTYPHDFDAEMHPAIEKWYEWFANN